MEAPELNVVTGAFGYTGKYITGRLLSVGRGVRTLTGHPNRENPFGEQVSVSPFNFDNPSELVKSLRGATTLYNTYWVLWGGKTPSVSGGVAALSCFGPGPDGAGNRLRDPSCLQRPD
jgi:uncharacterized protein YbjT (DUF2867 family)